MRVVIAGAHGRVARRLSRLLCARGDAVVGLVRTADHEADLTADGVEPVVLDIENSSTSDIAAILVVADAVVFAAGAPPESVRDRKDVVDRAGALRLADAAVEANIRRFLLMSSLGVEEVAAGGAPADADDEHLAYLHAKLAAEEGVRARPAVAATVLRPGRLTEEPGTGRVTLGRHVPVGTVSRDDVAAVILALLDAPRPGDVLEVVNGPTPIDEAVATVATVA